MSRGWSQLQRALLQCVADANKPMTYAEMILLGRCRPTENVHFAVL
jgi:hypothetical protein